MVDTTVLTATSQADNSVFATVTDTTTVQVQRLYVPLVLKSHGA